MKGLATLTGRRWPAWKPPWAFPRGFRGLALALGLAACVTVPPAAYSAAQWARERALEELGETAQARLTLYTATLTAELEKFRALPLALAWDPDVTALLTTPRDIALIDRVDRKLSTLNAGASLSALYVMGRDGITLASSNWTDETSFIGRDFSFRPYFQDALEGKVGRYFATGNHLADPRLLYSVSGMGTGLGGEPYAGRRRRQGRDGCAGGDLERDGRRAGLRYRPARHRLHHQCAGLALPHLAALERQRPARTAGKPAVPQCGTAPAAGAGQRHGAQCADPRYRMGCPCGARQPAGQRPCGFRGLERRHRDAAVAGGRAGGASAAAGAGRTARLSAALATDAGAPGNRADRRTQLRQRAPDRGSGRARAGRGRGEARPRRPDPGGQAGGAGTDGRRHRARGQSADFSDPVLCRERQPAAGSRPA